MNDDRFAKAKKISGLLPIRQLADGEVVDCEFVRMRKGKVGALLVMRDLDTSEEFCLPGHTTLLQAELEPGNAYRITRAGEQVAETTGRKFISYEILDGGPASALAFAIVAAGTALLLMAGPAQAVVPDIFWWLWR